MAKYLIETFYNCSIKVSHYLDKIDDNEIENLEKRDDGKFEILDIKLDKRNTKNLNKKINIDTSNKTSEINNSQIKNNKISSAIENKVSSENKNIENTNKRFFFERASAVGDDAKIIAPACFSCRWYQKKCPTERETVQ